jgi:hypothetical protein
MDAALFEHDADARAALRAIASDPAYGPDALTNVTTLSNLLQDFLPDAPRETNLLIAAASAGVPSLLREHISQGLDAATAVKLAAGFLATRTAFADSACTWVTTQLLAALTAPGHEGLTLPSPSPLKTEVVDLPQGASPDLAPGWAERDAAPTRAATPNVAAELAGWHMIAEQAGNAGNATAARDQYAALLRVRERVLGPEHPDTLSTRHNLASWTGEAGDPHAARDQYAELLRIRERVLGGDHPATLSTRHNLARWTGEAGDPVAARDQYAALLPIRERVLGPNHPATISTRARLTHWSKKAKRPHSSRNLH